MSLTDPPRDEPASAPFEMNNRGGAKCRGVLRFRVIVIAVLVAQRLKRGLADGCRLLYALDRPVSLVHGLDARTQMALCLQHDACKYLSDFFMICTV